VTRFPEGFEEAVRLPSSFGAEAYRGQLGGRAVVLFGLGPDAGSPEVLAGRLRRWETLSASSTALARPFTWFLEGTSFWLVFHDPGGPVVADLLEDGWSQFETALPPFLDEWQRWPGVDLVVVDPARLILSPAGLCTFDLIHLIDTGTPAHTGYLPRDLLFLSPEMTNRTSLGVDNRSGLFSLGALIYRLVCGRWPIDKNDGLERLHSLLNQAPDFSYAPWPDEPVLHAVVQKLLRKNPQDRYQTLFGLRWDLTQRFEGEAFVPGRHDRGAAIAEPQRTYGRGPEFERWDSALTALRSDRSVTLLLRGTGGQGKSRLVEEFRRTAEPEGVLWLQGKFDQFEPRFAAGALAQVLDQWVSSPWGLASVVRSGWTEVLRSQLGRHGPLLTNLIPALIPYLGSPPEGQPQEDNQQRLLRAVELFFSLVAAVRPVVIAIEDIHWADVLSLRLLETLQKARIPRLLLLGTCRPGVSSCSALVEAIEREPVPGGVRDLGPLDEASVADLLRDGSPLEADDRRALAALLVRHGGGNPFSIRILIREVNLRRAVVFDVAAGRWNLRLDLLRNLPRDQALSLVVERLRGLNTPSRTGLLVASLLGQFAADDVIEAGGLDPDDFDSLQASMMAWGLWDRAEPEAYRFSHDRMQLAAYETATDTERADAHLRLGRSRLVRHRRGEDVAPAAIAQHLNRTLSWLQPDEREDLFRLNIKAGEVARVGNDFAGSLGFYQAAVEQAAPSLWDSEPERMEGLYRSAAEAAYTEFRREQADAWCDEAVRLSKSAIARARVRERQQNYLFFQGDFEGSIAAGVQGLRELGVSIPERPSRLHVLAALAAVKIALVGKSPESLARQGENTNERSRITLLLLCGFIPPAFHAGKLELFGLAVLQATRLTVRDGNSPEAAPGYTGYALLLAAFGDLKGAYAFGKLAVAINQRYDDLTWRSMVLVLTGLFCHGWFEPWNRLRTRFEAARLASEESGEVLYLTYAQLFSTLWNPGEDLPKRKQRTEESLTLILKNRFRLTRVSAYFSLGSLGNLDGTKTGLSFTFDGFDPEIGLAEYRQVQSLSGLAVCYTEVALTAFVLGDLDRAKENLQQAESLRSAIAGSLYEEGLTLVAGLIGADLARRGELRRRRLGALARQARRWARNSPAFGFHAAVLQAEWLELRGRILEAQKWFLASIEAADQGGMLLHQALARERTARFFSRQNSMLAKPFLAESIDRWRRYGAWAKVALLEAEAGSVVPAPAPAGKWDVDRDSLIRALEAISGELRLEALSRAIVKVMLENSGAERVVLLTKDDDWVFEGEATAEGYRAGDRRALANLADLPQSLLRAALLEGRLLVREEVSGHERLIEPVLGTRGVKSLIVLPLTTNDGPQGLVYLENTVMPGVLTQSRVRILELLSSAIGIAVQNAQLFRKVQQANESLEARVEERTRELSASQRRILLQEKLASLGALTAGIAHELKNPINIINNFAESSIELMEELRADVAGVHDALSAEVSRNLDYLINELVQNMADIKRSGSRGNNIIRSMLMHTRGETGAPTVEDLNSLVQESVGLSFHGWKATHPGFDCAVGSDLDPRLPRIAMNRANLGRVLINLLNNAFQAVGGVESPLVSVSTRWLDPGLQVVVEDNGAGVPDEILDRIFQPFFTTKPPGEGTGLGLSISREIIHEEFGGTLEADSQPGRTRFIIVLPGGA
jgi:signal transduction histidine kinase/predicted ATPase